VATGEMADVSSKEQPASHTCSISAWRALGRGAHAQSAVQNASGTRSVAVDLQQVQKDVGQAQTDLQDVLGERATSTARRSGATRTR
jgi:hypothetical protein